MTSFVGGSDAHDRYSVYRAIYGEEGFAKLRMSKVLIVGAGGIGCEILKNMVLMGYQNLELIDLDTIDVSNLNRQFLFRPEHVGKPKAEIASQAAMAFNPDCEIKYHYNNIKNEIFNVAYFKNFDCVLNALDNVDARRHVNRLCLSAGIPLIDSGSTGYQGQVRPIMKGVTECYECREKPTQKVYPICTIRSTPDKPVHCIVWAKEAYKLLFGNTQESMLYEDPSVEESTFMKYVAFVDIDAGETANKVEAISNMVNTGQKLLTALYCDEIEKKVSTCVYDAAAIKPRIITRELFESAAKKAIEILNSSDNAKLKTATSSIWPRQQNGWDKKVWSDEDCIIEALVCIANICTIPSYIIGKSVFDKDDHDIMILVTSLANLRSTVFGIDTQCLYEAKGMAGNIIPAIATTNAIVSATQVEQACSVIIKGKSVINELRNTSVWRVPGGRGRYVLNPLKYVEEPIETCFVCQKNPVFLVIDTTVETLQYVVSKILKGKLGFNSPNIELGTDPIYEEGDGADEDLTENLSKVLCQCPAGGIKQDSELTVDDFTQDMSVIIIIKHEDRDVILQTLQNKAAEAAGTTGKADLDDAPPPDDAYYLEGTPPTPKVAGSAASAAVGQKRKSSEVDVSEGATDSHADKRSKVSGDSDVVTIEL